MRVLALDRDRASRERSFEKAGFGRHGASGGLVWKSPRVLLCEVG